MDQRDAIGNGHTTRLEGDAFDAPPQVELGVLSGAAEAGSTAERVEVREYIDRFADGCLRRARSTTRTGPTIGKGGAPPGTQTQHPSRGVL